MLTPVTSSKAFQLAKLLAATILLWAMLSAAASAGNEQVFDSGRTQATLVELFTSQGCSSCPPAERWLGGLKDDPRLWKTVIPVAFHVDYWDYIGWKDIYAKAEYSARQRRYRSEHGIRSVYTPGLVVNGQEWRGWYRKKPLPVSSTGAGQLRVALSDGQLKASYSAAKTADQALTLNVALLGVGLQVDVERGENAGRQLAQDFTVLQFVTLASSTGSWSAALPEIRAPDGSRSAIAVWVSANGKQKPLQATGGWLGQDR